MAVLLLATLCGAFGANLEEPSLSPSGLDLLYSERPAFLPSGEPVVALGLMHGQKTIRVRAAAPLRVELWQGEVLKQTVLQPGRVVSVSIRKSRAAQKQHYVDLEGVPFGDNELLAATLQAWQARGIKPLQTLEVGALFGLSGRVLDNRQYRIIHPTENNAAAARLANSIFERFALRASINTRLLERPWATLDVRVDNMPLAVATSYVRFSSPEDSTVEILGVEHGVGYHWHGREDRHYRGEIYAVVDAEGQLAAVNVVGAETVLAGVVPSEIFASAPAAALRAQAVAARNHLLSRLGKRHQTDPFHLCSEQHCQVYGGLSKEDARTTAAVLETAGQAVFLEGTLVDSVYSSSCGGHTENNDAVWGDKPNPALRARPDFVTDEPTLQAFTAGIDAENIGDWVQTTPKSYCATSKHVRMDKLRWQRTFDRQQLQSILSKNFSHLGPLRRIDIIERGPGGRVMTLKLAGSRQQALLLHELPIRRLFNNLNSGTFTLSPAYDEKGFVQAVTFTGAGWGHGVGMCQLGAIGRAEAGHDHQHILAHYYNGASLLTLYR